MQFVTLANLAYQKETIQFDKKEEYHGATFLLTCFV